MRAALCLAFALAAIPLAAADELDLKGWHVVCGEDGYCAATAEANPQPGEVPPYDYLLRIGRHAQQSYWEVAFVTVAAQADVSKGFVVEVDGQSEIFSRRSEIDAYGAVTDFYLLGDKAQRIMDLMMPGQRVTFDYTDITSQPREVSFRLSGLTSALLWIDEQQGRIGSERVASVAPYGLVPAGEDQGEPPQVPQAVLDRHSIDPECRPFAELANGSEFTTAALDAEHTLYLIPCWSAAYNFGWKAYVVSGDTIEQQYFADYASFTGWTGTPYVVNAYYDPEFKELGSFYKARGVGDCGSSGTWKWNGYVFRLEEFRYRDCDEGATEPAEDLDMQFPVIYAAPPETRGATQ